MHNFTNHANALPPELRNERDPVDYQEEDFKHPNLERNDKEDSQSIVKMTSIVSNLRTAKIKNRNKTFKETENAEDLKQTNPRRQRITFINRRKSNGRLGGNFRIITNKTELSSITTPKSSPGQPALAANFNSTNTSTKSVTRNREKYKLVRRPAKTSEQKRRTNNHIFHQKTINKRVRPELKKGSIQTQPEQLINSHITVVGDIETITSLNISFKIDEISPSLTIINGTTRSVRHYRYRPTPQSYIIQKKSKICIFEGVTYGVGEKVPTTEPCLECICYERTIICGLRVCPKISLVRDQLGLCKVTHTEGVCCPDVVCSEGGKKHISFKILRLSLVRY